MVLGLLGSEPAGLLEFVETRVEDDLGPTNPGVVGLALLWRDLHLFVVPALDELDLHVFTAHLVDDLSLRTGRLRLLLGLPLSRDPLLLLVVVSG
jgi:hypothetical protein